MNLSLNKFYLSKILLFTRLGHKNSENEAEGRKNSKCFIHRPYRCIVHVRTSSDSLKLFEMYIYLHIFVNIHIKTFFFTNRFVRDFNPCFLFLHCTSFYWLHSTWLTPYLVKSVDFWGKIKNKKKITICFILYARSILLIVSVVLSKMQHFQT